MLQAIIWLADMKDFAEMNSVWDKWVDRRNTPARATGEAKLAGPQYKVEIIITAAIVRRILVPSTRLWLCSVATCAAPSLRAVQGNDPGAELRREPCHQRVAVAGIGERDQGHRLVGAPGAPFDHQARAAVGDVEGRRRLGVAAVARMRVLGSAPRNAADQPWSGRDLGKALGRCIGHGG